MLSKLSVIAICAALPLLAVKQRVELITSDHADVAAGSLIHIEGSTGELNVAGWDQPSVEVIATRYTFEEERGKARAGEKLKRIEVAKMVAANGELTILTHRNESGIHVDYQIMVPRSSSLTIHHHIGDVVIIGVGGDVDATNGAGDILLQVSDLELYKVDAKSRFGTVYSDLNTARHHGVIGENLAADVKSPLHHINLRVGVGGITVQDLSIPELHG
jgi:hypothetical protein